MGKACREIPARQYFSAMNYKGRESKMKIKRILAAALAALTLGLTITGCSSNGGSGDDDTIVVGLDVGFAPMGFEQDGEIVGFDIDLARAVIEDKMGKTVQFQPIDWDSKEGELNTGKIDLIWNGLSRSPEREENMALTKSYLKNDQILVVKSDSGIASSADLTGKVLAMQEGSTAEDAWSEFSQENPDITPSTVNLLSDNVVCLTELEQDKADVVLMDSVVAEYYLSTNESYSNLTILDDVIASEEYAVAAAKDNTELRDEVNQGLEECVEDGTAAQISEKWFGSDIIYWEE